MKRLVPLLVKNSFVSKREKVDEHLRPALPSTTVDAYDNAQYRKKKAATHNFAAKTIGGALGTAAGYGIYRAVTRGKGFNGPVKIAGLKKPMHPERAKGILATTITGTGSGVGGYIGAKESLRRIKNDPQYRYRKAD
ncbi:MAG: hypothetical protein E6Q97_04055 [Desulfurellales bacterium]|nr:MAG: hypothetical protein E6Q97_04055 [Desulfurellales bacterium]